MRLPVLIIVCVSLAAASLLNAAQFSKTRNLSPLKLASSELDAILIKIHSFVDAANGRAEQGPIRETVKLAVGDRQIEIPHFSLASSVAFPNEIFGFSYAYYQADEPISSVAIDLGDSSRRVFASGESADQVEGLSNLLANEFHRHSSPIGGTKIRRVAGTCLSMLFFDRQRVLLEESTLQVVGNTGLFYDRFFAGDLRAVAPAASRLYPLPTLFAFLSNQACASDLSPRASCSSCWNSSVTFSFAKRAVAILW